MANDKKRVHRQHNNVQIDPNSFKMFKSMKKQNQACKVCKWRQRLSANGFCCCGWLERHQNEKIGERRRPCAYNPNGPCDCFEEGPYIIVKGDDDFVSNAREAKE